MTYFLFFSYARDNFNADGHLKKFYEDLELEIRTSFGPSDGLICFRDATSIDIGSQWADDLAKAVCSAKVFVPILSPAYFDSEWCGKEWHIFDARIEQYYKDNQSKYERKPSLILPVLWTDKSLMKIPACVNNLQFQHESLGEIYAQEGLRYLKNLKRSEYKKFVSSFAKTIISAAKIYDLPEIDHKKYIEWEKIENSFQKSIVPISSNADNQKNLGPKTVQFIYVAGCNNDFQAGNVKNKDSCCYAESSDLWKPYYPPIEKEIYDITYNIALENKFKPECLSCNDSLIEMIMDSQNNNKIVVIIIDPWTLYLPQYSSIMKSYDRLDFYNCAVLITFNPNDFQTNENMEELKSKIQEVFDTKITHANPEVFRDEITSEKDLQHQLVEVLQITKKKIISRSERIRRINKSTSHYSKPVIHATML